MLISGEKEVFQKTPSPTRKQRSSKASWRPEVTQQRHGRQARVGSLAPHTTLRLLLNLLQLRLLHPSAPQSEGVGSVTVSLHLTVALEPCGRKRATT